MFGAMKMAKRLKVAPFKFKPFSQKQLKVLTWWMPGSPVADKDAIICDGAVRSGKTIVMSLSYVIWAMKTFNSENFGMSGKTIGALRRNVIIPLKRILKSRGYKIKDHRADNCLTISFRGHSNTFYLFGGKDERSQDLIQGITLAGMFFDEVALMPKSFVDQATARCSVEGSKLWFNCNPAGPYHWFKTEWLEKLKEKNALHLHFTMDDNLSLSSRVKERYRRMYSGVFFKRYILGLWVMAEGVIFSMFDEDKHKKPRSWMPTEFDRKFICIDFGTNNPCVFLQYGVKDGIYYELKEYYHDGRKKGQKTNGQYANDLMNFIDGDEYAIFVDPSAASLIIELKERGVKNIRGAVNKVLDGIQTVANRFENDQLYICEDNHNSIKELFSYVWDDKAAERGEDKPLKRMDHACDAKRYGIHTDYLIQLAKKRKAERKAKRNKTQ